MGTIVLIILSCLSDARLGTKIGFYSHSYKLFWKNLVGYKIGYIFINVSEKIFFFTIHKMFYKSLRLRVRRLRIFRQEGVGKSRRRLRATRLDCAPPPVVLLAATILTFVALKTQFQKSSFIGVPISYFYGGFYRQSFFPMAYRL